MWVWLLMEELSLIVVETWGVDHWFAISPSKRVGHVL